MGQRQVVINLGSASGVQPETTFTIFGAGPYGGAEKHLKGTVEVSRVIDANTALARITSLYDAEGHEIVLNDQGTQRIQRESESALREGDLLFNMFWGQPVALAGPVNLGGQVNNSPAEQMRRLQEFAYYLDRLGMPVDAYLDLADGTIKGKIGWNTRYLILGPDLAADGPGDQGERAKALKEVVEAMKKEAAEKGLFMISLENFLNVAGYRAPRSAAAGRELAGFRPKATRAGSVMPHLFGPGRPAAPPPEIGAPVAPEPAANPEEKKALEKKEEDK
jgi:hypothetical protein